ncbi:uncharacterized protein LOC127860820 isoform X1 [Dreissena polymorpha]|uniref:uncharacterized protein LOC127860820 isoform X1 n=1 Tax=Dreissena polymorpha TaxID=45954 RepID=UPI0022641F4E|nr:uncharacterized protein LOC127860820 isoform X1 [Dreissena polymorpha]XP_052255080.1 uncharacterized protein LOC127860820 isoform X1 [Dreissena polymorpha]XP_052255090.1 uncharacterized protein LOC127860820 isoform X1 [Dreissena polymorpha]XP_052255099.1 uncharacterized protein LOC127860820 isoform X1 [Dreissena polymorpha]
MLTMANMGRWQTQLCALATLAVLLHQCQVSGRICEPSNRTGPVFFTQVLNVAEYINYGASKALLCCASGFHSIQWHILNATAAWEPYPPDGSGTEQPNTEEDDQVLRIHHAMDFQNTQFRCDLIVNGTVVLSHTVRLYVSHCSTRAKGPILIEPFPQNQTIYDYGGNISLYCTGDFGCYKHNDIQIVRWSVGNNASGFSDRYHLVTNESEDKATLGVTLTIEKVEPIDTTIAFVCTIMNDQFYHGQTDRIVWITKKDRPESPTMMIVMAVCIPVGVFLTTFLVVICVYRCCGPQVKLCVYVNCPCCRRKGLDEEKYEYHVFLYHADDDGEKAEKIKQKLTEKFYDVFISADINAGTEFVVTTSAYFDKSAAVHFLYTNNLLHDRWALRFLTTLMEYGKDILCLEIDDLEPEHVISTIEEGQLETDGSVMNGVEIKSVSNDVGFWKRLPKVKVPTEKDSQRKHKNFWCHLQNKLPKPGRETMVNAKAKCDDNNRRNSERPLLAESAPSSPMNFIGPRQEVSPTSDAVFEYDENTEYYHRNANMDNALRAETYLHNQVLQLNPQQATIYDRILDQVERQDSDHDIAMAHMYMNALETENEQVTRTIVADNQTHENKAEDLKFIDPNWSNHDTDQHGNASHCDADNLIHPMRGEGFMYSGGESPPTNASMSRPSDFNDYLFRSGSYTGSSSGYNSAGISGQSDRGYSRSETSSSFVGNSGTSQSLSPTNQSFNGLSSGEFSSVTDSGVLKHVDKKALTLTIGPTGHTQNVSNTFVSPESGYKC